MVTLPKSEPLFTEQNHKKLSTINKKNSLAREHPFRNPKQVHPSLPKHYDLE